VHQYVKHINKMNKKLYQTAGKKDDPFKNLIDVTNGIPKNYKQVGGKLINLTKTSDKEKEISMEGQKNW